MKILLIGSDQVWSLERIYLRHLLEEGVEAELFATQNLFYEYNSKGIANKIKVRLGISRIFKDINLELRRKIHQYRPDIVWIFKGMEILPETLNWIRSEHILTVNYNPDNPFIFSGRGSGNKYVTRSIPLYDLHFTYNLEVKGRLEEGLHLRSAFLPFGFDLADDIFLSAAAEKEVVRLCFLGNPDLQRAAVIKQLVQAGISIDLYGNDWQKFVKSHPLQRIFPPVYGDDFWKTLRRYRVQLNLMRIHNENSHNMRSFEVPGIGGIMLAPATAEHRLFFANGRNAFLFSGTEDCLQLARHILDLSEEEALGVRNCARRTSLEEGYTYRERVKGALREIKSVYEQIGDPSL